jgi:hypothetical protein
MAKRSGEILTSDPLVNERRERQAQEASAASWAAWSEAIATRLVAVETRVRMYLGDPDSPDDADTVLATLVGEMMRDAEKERAAAIAQVADALREKIEVEINVLHDEFTQGLDRKILDHAPGQVKKLEQSLQELKRAHDRRAPALDEKLAAAADRLDALERKRDVRNLTVQVASLHAQLKGLGGLEAQLKELRERLDLTRADVRALEQVVADAGIATLVDPPVLALPSPN